MLKEFLPAARARTIDTLNNCIAWGMDLITPDVFAGLYRHRGYDAHVSGSTQ